ncbi:uncharacterized protein cenpt isoform X1 [Gasterosteus aculeatus]
MEPTEDLSARVLLQHILSTEPPRTPITRSTSKATKRTTTATTSSARRSNRDARGQTPQDILRRSLRHKLHQSITRPAVTKRASASAVLGRMSTPAPTSLLFDDGDTPRHILRNILRTEPVKSPVVHGKIASEERLPSSADSSVTGKRPSIELSGLDLPDITIGNAASTAKGLARKRPRRSLNVTAFEKRLKDGDDVEGENESIGDNLSLSSLSSTSLSLKTPFVDPRTERKGLQRRVSNRRKITVEEFGAAVHRRQTGGVTSFVQETHGLNETTHSEGFTLGLSKLSEPDITTDILHCNTALYPQPESMTSSFSITATQDKPTVMASQLQRLIEQEELMEAEHSELGGDKPMHAFPYEEGAEPEEEQDMERSQSNVKSDAAESEEEEIRVGTQTDAEDSQTEEEHGGVDSQHEEDVDARSQSEEEEAAAEFRTDNEGAGDSQTEEVAVESEIGEEVVVESEIGEEVAVESEIGEEVVVESEIGEEVAVESLTGEEVVVEYLTDDVVEYLTEEEVIVEYLTEEEGAGGSQTEGELDGVDSQDKEDAAPDSQREEDDAVDSQIEEEGAVDPLSVADVLEHQSDPAADPPPEDERDGRPEEEDSQLDLQHVSRRAQLSEGGPVMPVTVAGGDLADATDAGWSESRAHSSLEMDGHESGRIGVTEDAETGASYSDADADKENSFGLPEVAHDVEDGRHLSLGSPEVDAPQDSAEQVEEWEDEEDDEDSDEIPSKTPAFVKQKINFLQPNPLASPQFKNIQASSSSTGDGFPAPKPKPVRKRGKRPAKKETDLPKSYLMAVFKHFAKTKVSTDVYPVLKEIMDKYFDRLVEDLETYAAHAKRKTIEVEDAELLLKRQGYVSDKVPVEVLIEKYLRMDQRKLLIPIATSGNVVVPKKRR